MNYEELDEAEKERRKKAMIEYRSKKRFSAIFMTVASICEIIMTLVIIIAIFVVIAFISTRLPNVSEKAAAWINTIGIFFSFFGGLFIGFVLYKKLVCVVINKFNLEDKLIDDVLNHYTKQMEKLEEKKRR